MRRLSFVALACALCVAAAGAARSPHAVAATQQPNIVLILTDDQRWDELGFMPQVQSLMQSKGATFTNSFVSNSLCCPSRSTVLTGLYSHSTDVYFNSPPHGGFATFHAGPYESTHTLPIWLSAAGYRTGLIGKYMNGYGKAYDKVIPKGWSYWFGENITSDGYFNWYASDNGTRVSYGATDADYSTDVLAQKSVGFINSTPASQPLFLWFAPHAPHDPATPPTRYATACKTYSPPRSPNVGVVGPNEPSWVRTLTWTAKQQANSDLLMRKRCRALLAVDDAVGSIVKALSDTGRLDNTLIVFASDNGWSAGSHRWQAKRVPWNEGLRVPLIMRWDGHIQAGVTDSDLAVNVDWTSTFADAAGITLPSDVEGHSLLPGLSGVGTPRSDFPIESFDSGWPASGKIPPFCGARTKDWLYVRYATGEQELYDERSDPFELHNLANDPSSAATLADMVARMQADHCAIPSS